MINSFLANLKYDYQIQDDGTLMITKYSGNASDVEIPSSIKHMKVTSIGAKAFFRNIHLKTVVIPDGVLSIGDQAFSGCGEISDIKLPEGLQRIGDYAFSDCWNLSDIKLPEGLQRIGDYAFSNCWFKTITIPGSISCIGNHAFSDNIFLESIAIPENVAVLGVSVFSNCNKLKSIIVYGRDGKNYELGIPVLVRKKKPTSEKYVCPYCGTKITPETILFCETVKTKYADKAHSSFLRYHGVLWNQDDMFHRVYYKAIPGINVKSQDIDGYPTMIEIDPKDAIIPVNSTENAWSIEWLMKKVIELRRGKTKNADSFDSFDDDDLDYYASELERHASDTSLCKISGIDDYCDDLIFDDGYDYDFDSEGFDADKKDTVSKSHTVTERACPYCHCKLPQKFGALETYHVAVLGGFASGKTAFIISLFDQLNAELKRCDLGSVILEEESLEYLRPMTGIYKQFGTTIATLQRSPLPIVCRYENDGKEAFFVFHEISSEGTTDPNNLEYQEVISICEHLFLMIDSTSFFPDSLEAKTGDCWVGRWYEFLSEEWEQLKSHTGSIRSVVAVITKMDILKEKEKDYSLPDDFELFKDVGEIHRGAVTLSVINRKDECLEEYLEKHHFYGLKRLFSEGTKTTILGVSAKRNMLTGMKNEKQQMIEPFLVMLMQLGMIPFRNYDDRLVWSVKDVDWTDSAEYPPIINKLAAMFVSQEEIKQEDEPTENEASELDDFDF